ncbi:MAG: arsenate reductase (glutaredoxin) [Alphaproteobacteria bacterium]|nr:arsenate reductase (glutaredoxin) [Alphaproteobacteria bacterium]
MSSITIYHNPRCTKSRKTLELLKEKGFDPEVIEYLKNPPTPQQLMQILEKLGMNATQIIRTNEPKYAELNLFSSRVTEEGLIEYMCEFPILIERPIVVHGDKAAIGRPPENILAIL